MNRGIIFSAIVIVLAAAGLFGYRWYTGHDVAVGTDRSTTRSASEPGPDANGLAATDSVVNASGRWVSAGHDGGRAVDVVLDIDDGWHVNANPASLDSLVPTEVSARVGGHGVPATVTYPPGRDSGVSLDDKPIAVYDDGTIVTVELPAGAMRRVASGSPLTLDVRAQSCSDDGTCLAPATLPVDLRGDIPDLRQ